MKNAADAYVWTDAVSSLSAPSALPSGTTAITQAGSDNSTLVATTAQVHAAISGGAASPLNWSGTWVNGIIAQGSYQQFMVPVAITVTRLELVALTANVTGCSTWPVFGIYDQNTTSMVTSITLSSGGGPWDTGVISASVASGHVLRMRVNVAGVGCTGNPNLGATMQYHP